MKNFKKKCIASLLWNSQCLWQSRFFSHFVHDSCHHQRKHVLTCYVSFFGFSFWCQRKLMDFPTKRCREYNYNENRKKTQMSSFLNRKWMNEWKYAREQMQRIFWLPTQTRESHFFEQSSMQEILDRNCILLTIFSSTFSWCLDLQKRHPLKLLFGCKRNCEEFVVQENIPLFLFLPLCWCDWL